MSFEVIVVAMRLISVLVDKGSDSNTLVPSDRTTLSSGAIMKAKGSLSVKSERPSPKIPGRRSYVRDAFDDEERNVSVGGNTALNALLVILRQATKPRVSRSERKHTFLGGVSRHVLYCAADELPEVSRNDPEGQILATRLGRGKGHDGSGLGGVPASGADSVKEGAKNEIL